MEQEQNVMSNETLADKLAAWVITGLLFLLPVFFIPSPSVPFQFTKVILAYVGILACLISWIIGRLKDGKITLVRPKMLAAFGVVILVYFVSALFSPARSAALIGQGFEISTFSFIAAMGVLLFLTSSLFTDRRRVTYAYLAFIVSFVVVALYQFLRLMFGPAFLSFGILTGVTDNLVGSWSDLGIYFGAVALFSFVTLELLKLPRWIKTVFIIILAVSLFFLSVIGFVSVWYMLGIFSLIFFIYNFSLNKSKAAQQESPLASSDGRRAVPVISLIILIISFIFILFKGNIYTTISTDLGATFFSRFSISNVEVRPSWLSTWNTGKATVVQHPLLGVGPNRFANAWLLSKPAEINNTVFWATDFNYGIGLIPTFAATTGVIGILIWILFVGFFLYTGFRVLFAQYDDVFVGYLSISSFILALYFWLFAIIHVPSSALIVSLFIFTGLSLALSLSASARKPVRTFDIISDPRVSFVSVLVLIGLLLGVLVFGYSISKKFIAAVDYNQALAAANNRGDIKAAEQSINRALAFSQNDLYYRTLSELNLVKLNMLLSQKDVSQDVLKSQFQSYLGTAQAAAQLAIGLDKTKYENWIMLGRVYETVVPFNAANAYEQAMTAYTEARRLNPLNPAILLMMARLEVAHKNTEQAKTYIAEALKLKNNYTDAIYLLAQIQVGEGDLKSATQSVEAATFITPNDPGVYFQLGLLRYNSKDYSGAVSALEQALNLAPDYANVKYFLGLSLAKLGKTNDAIKQFQDIKAANSDNADLDIIISNLQAGRDPLAKTQAATDASKRTQPPVKEKSATSKTSATTSDR